MSHFWPARQPCLNHEGPSERGGPSAFAGTFAWQLRLGNQDGHFAVFRITLVEFVDT